MEYFVIGDEDTVLGFGMVGVRGTAVASPEAARKALETALSEKETGIIIITERIAEHMRLQVDRNVYTRQFPLIIEIPDRKGKMPGRPGIRETINAAIGVNF